jgi:hypothetical protein
VVTTIERSIKQTYVALRWAILVFVGLLLLAVLYTGWSTGAWQTSISGYYYTAARPVFVASLCAIGACLVLYHADNPENLLLDFAGFLAFVVAFVPTAIDFREPPPGTLNVPTATDVASTVQASVLALLVAGVIAVFVGWTLWRREFDVGPDESIPTHTKEALAVCLVALSFGLAIYFFASTLIENHAHWVAAVSMFVLLFFVVLVNTRQVDRRNGSTGFWSFVRWSVRTLFTRNGQQGASFRLYVTAARLMPASAVVLGLLGLAGFGHWIFWAEAVMILLFGIFWQRQTAEFLNRSSQGPLQLQA